MLYVCTLPGSHRVVTFCYMYTSWVVGYGIWDMGYGIYNSVTQPFSFADTPSFRSLGCMAYNDGRVVRGWFHLNKPLHPATHVVRGATLSGKGYVYRVSGGLFFSSNALHMTITLTHVLGHIERFPWGVCTYTSQSVDLFFDVGRVT